MLYKRPSLRRGGTPTGIETLEPRVQAQKGLFVRDEITNELRPSKGIFSSDFNKQVFNADGTPIKFELKKPSDFADDALLLFGPGKFLKAGGAGLNILKQAGKFGTKPDFYGTTTGVLSKNLEKAPLFSNQRIREVIRPYTSGIMETTKAAGRGTKDFFKNYGIAAGTGGGLGTAAFFGLGDYLEDEPGKSGELPGEDDPTLDEGDSLSGIIDKVVSDKKTKKEKKGKTEDSFKTEFNKQYNRLEKFLGANKSEDKGRLALALSEAIGTPGSISDKASVLNKSLLNIAAGRKKDKKDLTKLAFAAATEIEKANIAAGKKSFEEKRYDKLLQNVNIVNNPVNFSKEEVDEAKASIRNISNLQELLKGSKGDFTLTGNTLTVAIAEAQKIQRKLDKELAKDNPDLSKIQGYQKSLRVFQALLNKDLSGISTALGLKKGGRVNLAESFPGTAGEAANTEPATQTANIDKLSFNELRTRLPKEITDDIVVLLSNDDQALQDFAYIRTQGDIDKFNLKYGVTLVLPPESA